MSFFKIRILFYPFLPFFYPFFALFCPFFISSRYKKIVVKTSILRTRDIEEQKSLSIINIIINIVIDIVIEGNNTCSAERARVCACTSRRCLFSE